MNRVVIVMDGGVIQHVMVNDPLNTEIIVKDYDVEGDARIEKMPLDDPKKQSTKFYAYNPFTSTLKEEDWTKVMEGRDICMGLEEGN